MAIKEVTPQQAHDLLTANSDAVYIDVRTEREFANGHPQGAVNIPVAFADPARGMMANKDFVKSSKRTFRGRKRSSSAARRGRAPMPPRDCCSRRAFKTLPICSAASAACAIKWEMSSPLDGPARACQ